MATPHPVEITGGQNFGEEQRHAEPGRGIGLKFTAVRSEDLQHLAKLQNRLSAHSSFSLQRGNQLSTPEEKKLLDTIPYTLRVPPFSVPLFSRFSTIRRINNLRSINLPKPFGFSARQKELLRTSRAPRARLHLSSRHQEGETCG
jgi:hypothetical protein